MGIPYSKQINAAFDQVTPLVAAGFEVLETTKNISILLAAIQVLTVVFLAFILLALIGLLFTLNPDLHAERDELVTPAMRWLGGWIKWILHTRVLKAVLAATVLLLFSIILQKLVVWGVQKELTIEPETPTAEGTAEEETE